MAGILWLASYPKSGNTWLRAFLANLFANSNHAYNINELKHYSFGEMSSDLYENIAGKPLDTLTDLDIYRLRPQVHRFIASRRSETALVKTHNAIATHEGVPAITPDVTEGAIYMVRNPLDIVLSYADHYGVDIDAAISTLNSADSIIRPSASTVFQYLSDWSSHVQSWTRAPGLHCHVVRYEDLLARPIDGFADIARYLGVKATRGHLRHAVRNSSFKELKRQEKRQGFVEKSRHAEAFFRKGKANQWRDELSREQIERIVEAHGEIMTEFGYLPRDR